MQKYCLISGVVLAYDEDNQKNKAALTENLRKVDYKTPIAEVVYKNLLSSGQLSAQ